MRLLITFLMLVLPTTVLAEKFVCSASYDDGSATLTATLDRVEKGFEAFLVTTSPYSDFPRSDEDFFHNELAWFGYGKTVAIENGRSLALIRHDAETLEVYFIEFEKMGFTARTIYGGKHPVELGGEIINEDINQNYMVGSCVKRD